MLSLRYIFNGSCLLTYVCPPPHCRLIQITATSAYLGEESNVSALSGVVGSLISAQVAGIVVGQNPEEASTDFFRLSTGLYDAATVGGVQVTSVAIVYLLHFSDRRKAITLIGQHRKKAQSSQTRALNPCEIHEQAVGAG